MNSKKKLSTLNIVIIAMFTALLSVSSYISLALPNGSHLTFLNFMIVLVAFVFPMWQAALIILVWLILGAIGVPVFISGASGLGYLLGPWGGYNFAFLANAIVFAPIAAIYFKFAKSGEKNAKKFATKNIILAILTILSMCFIDAFGSIWYMVVAKVSLGAAFLAGFLPFLPLDMVKAIVLVGVIPFVRKLITSLKDR